MTTIIYKSATNLQQLGLPNLFISKIKGEGVKRVCIKIDGECEGYITLGESKERLVCGEATFDMSHADDGVYEPRLVTVSKVLSCAKFRKIGDRILFAEDDAEESAALRLELLRLSEKLSATEGKLLALEEKVSHPGIFKIG